MELEVEILLALDSEVELVELLISEEKVDFDDDVGVLDEDESSSLEVVLLENVLELLLEEKVDSENEVSVCDDSEKDSSIMLEEENDLETLLRLSDDVDEDEPPPTTSHFSFKSLNIAPN